MRFNKGVIPALVAFAAIGGTGLVSYEAIAAQATANSSISIAGPIGITKTQDLAFGSVSPSGVAGTVTIANDGTQSATGGVTALGGGPTQAQFTVTGDSGAAYTVDINGGGAAMTLTNGTPADDMLTTAWTNDSGGVITGGSVTLSVGATLAVAASQPAGTYTGSFTVDVVY